MLQPLFGGTLQCQVPINLVDVSNFRQVPDHQEVFVTPDSDDATLSVEIVEHSEQVEDAKASQYYFEDLAAGNEAQSWTIERVGNSDAPILQSKIVPVASVTLCAGIQYGVSKFHLAGQNDLAVWLAIVRIPSHNADIILSLSLPIRPTNVVVGGAEQIFNTILSSLSINDKSLFA